MLYFFIDSTDPTKIESVLPAPLAGECPIKPFITRNDLQTREQAEDLAAAATAIGDGYEYAVSYTPHCYPQFDVFRMPRVGDDVSRVFNGDAYPVGKIARISKTGKRVTCDDGSVFYRLKETAKWVEQGGCFGMVQGTHDYRNPSF